MIKIRLRRVGAKKQPSYRIVVADARSPRDGRFIENIGHHNPRTEPETVVIDAERATYWLGQGAQPTDAVARLLRKEGILAPKEPPAAESLAPAPAEEAPTAEEPAAEEPITESED